MYASDDETFLRMDHQLVHITGKDHTMKTRRNRRPMSRPQKQRSAESLHGTVQNPVFQPLEPRKLLTTLYANPGFGQTNVFEGWIAMPNYILDPSQPLDASNVEDRSVRVRITITEENISSLASVTILDLDGNTLFPWLGQPDGNGGMNTEIEVSLATGDGDEDDDGFWGTEDDITEGVFGLDGGIIPGWRFFAGEDEELFTADDIIIPDAYFNPVQLLTFDEEEGWDTDSVPSDYEIVIPQTGSWLPGDDGLYNGGDQAPIPYLFDPYTPDSAVALDTRLPSDFAGGGSDDRIWGTADDVVLSASDADPWRKPDLTQTEAHLVDITVDPNINASLNDLDAERFRHAVGQANDGIADFNNGIGQIIFSGTTVTTRISIVIIDEDGFVVEPLQLPDEGTIGIDLDRDAFGNPVNPLSVIQMPGMGQIIIGNNTHADWTADNSDAPLLPAGVSGAGWQDFAFESSPDFPDRLPEGISFQDPDANESIGAIVVDGAFFGVARFPGAVGAVNFGYFGGGMIVDGEIDGVIVGGSAGFIQYTNATGNTNAFLQVGRNLGSFITGGSMAADISVTGDFQSAEDRPFLAHDVFEYEQVIQDANQELINAVYGGVAGVPLMYILETGEDVEDATYYTNDTIGTAQFVNRASSRSIVTGSIGGGALVGPHSGVLDAVDFYAVAVNGQSEIRIQVIDLTTGLDLAARVTVINERGEIMAARGLTGESGQAVFVPDYAGVIYIQIDNSNNFQAPRPYEMTVQGIESVTLGEVNSYAPMQYTFDGGSAISTDSGSIGSVRSGQDQIEQTLAYIANVAIDSAGSIWNVTAGSSLGQTPDDGVGNAAPVSITADEYIGSVIAGVGQDITGQGNEFTGGSIVSGLISAGKDIGRIWAQGIGLDGGEIGGFATEDTLGAPLSSTVNIVAGGSIGVIHADNRIYGKTNANDPGVSITIGANGQVDLIEAGAQVIGPDGEGNYDLARSQQEVGIRDGALELIGGLGSNFGFVRAPFAYSVANNGDSIVIGANEVVEFVDDSGAVFTIQVTAGQNTGGVDSTSSARIITAPIAGSRGVSVTRIVANLHFGADLIINNNSGNVEIGDIIVTGSAFNTHQNILFNGNGKTDVYMLRAIGAFDNIKNTTDGDIIALDVRSVEEVRWNGNIGVKDNLVAIGPHKIGPDLGLAIGAPAAPPLDTVATTEQINALLSGTGVQMDWIVGSNLIVQTGSLSDQDGMPFDQYLNGISYRQSNANRPLEKLLVDGALGDAIIQNTVERIIVNNDGFTPFGSFHGVVGTVFANGNIEFMNVGDGLIEHAANGPRLTAGIMAYGQIEHLLVEGEGHELRGFVAGLGVGTYSQNIQNVDFGIGHVEGRNGANFNRVGIVTDTFDDFWTPNSQPRADVDRVTLKDGNMIDSVVRGVNINRIEIKGGYWDASRARVLDNIDRIIADEFIDTNTDPAGVNRISASGNVNRIETWGRKGDINELIVEVLGNLDRLQGFNLVGLDIDVDEVLGRVDAKGRISRSNFTTGTVEQFKAVEDITRVSVDTAGPIKKFQSQKGSISRVDILVDGPDARIDNLDAAIDISGDISVSGRIKKIKTKTGDITARIHTFSGDGDIDNIQAGRDALVELDIDGALKKIQAKRNIGDGGSFIIRGDLGNLDAKSGVVDGQFIVEGALKSFKALSFASGSNLSVRESIKKVDIDTGGLDGSIISYSGGINKIDIGGGDFAAGGLIAAYEGELKTLNIVGGDANGTIHADNTIKNISIKSKDSLGGDFAGIIQSNLDISKISITGNATAGSVVHAMTILKNLDIKGAATGLTVGAGESVDRVGITGLVSDSFFLGGLESLGADNAVGGAGFNEDRFSSGDVNNLTFNSGMDDTIIAAGVTAGVDGLYTTVDGNTDLAPGESFVNSVRVNGAITGSNLIIADTGITKITTGDPVTQTIVDADAPTLPGTGTQIEFTNGTSATFTEADGDIVTATLKGNGTGTLEHDGAGNLTGIIFTGTDSKTNVDIKVTTVAGSGVVELNDADIVAADDASFNTFNFDGDITGTSNVTIDGSVSNFTAKTINTTGTISIGIEAKKFTVDTVLAGSFSVTNVDNFETKVGGFSGNWVSEVIGNFRVSGDVTDASIFGRDEIGSLRVDGAFGLNPAGEGLSPAYAATNGRFGSFTADSTDDAIISAGNELASVNVNGDVTRTTFLAGMILGSDANYGGTGTAADQLTGGVIGNISVKGDWVQSSAAAGIDRGADTYYGTTDDVGYIGASEFGQVSINGDAVGSAIFSETFAFVSTGEMPKVKANGNVFTQNGNLTISHLPTTPEPLVVTSTDILMDGDVFTATVTFSIDADLASIKPDADDPFAESAFSISSADGGVDPIENVDYALTYDLDTRTATIAFELAFAEENPGIYTISIDGETMRSASGVLLDANEDGTVGDDYMFNMLVGDAGDRVVEGQEWDHDGNPATDEIHFRASSDLNLIMSDLVNGTGIANHEVKVVERIGDHPQSGPFFFPDRFDVDLYAVTLAEGDIFFAGLESVPGSGLIGSVTLRTTDGGIAASQNTLGVGYMVTTGGDYVLAVMGGGAAGLQDGIPFDVDITDTSGVNDPFFGPVDPDAITNDIGRYELSIYIHQDGDTGFASATSVDLTTGEVTDLESAIGRLDNVGFPDSSIGFRDADVWDISTVRTDPGLDGIFGTGDDTITTQLSEGMTVTIVLSVEEFGSDIGSLMEVGLFNTSATTGMTDAILVASPEAEVPGSGDLAFTVRVPENATYAVYVQGSVESNYKLSITVDADTAGDRRAEPAEQNIFLELNGGFADWLGRFGTELDPFDLSSLGFETLETSILSDLTQQVEDKFDAAGVDVNVSINPADFSGEEFTTVFLASNFGDENAFGGIRGSHEEIDPLNSNAKQQAVVFVDSHDGFEPGQEELFTNELANTLTKEVAHTLGLRLQSSLDDGITGFSSTAGLELNFSPLSYGLSEFFFGFQNEVAMLEWAFDVD